MKFLFYFNQVESLHTYSLSAVLPRYTGGSGVVCAPVFECVCACVRVLPYSGTEKAEVACTQLKTFTQRARERGVGGPFILVSG